MKKVMTTTITESQCGTGIRQNWTEMAQQSGIADIYHREHGLEMRHFENIKKKALFKFKLQTLPQTTKRQLTFTMTQISKDPDGKAAAAHLTLFPA